MGQTLDKPIIEKEEISGENSYLSYGCANMQGFRLSNEDRHVCEKRINFRKGTKTPIQGLSFFAVYDGHSGQSAAHFCSMNLLNILMKFETERLNKLPNSPSKVFSDNETIVKSHLHCDEEFRETFKENLDHSGCTAISTMIIRYSEKKIGVVCMNVGDSRCVVFDGTNDHALSFDHKPGNRIELERIQKAGGYVELGRVNGSLALSRALGDVVYKRNDRLGPREQCVVAVPDIERCVITKEKGSYQFVVLACDGIWDVMTNSEVCKFVKERLIQQELGTYYKSRDKFIQNLYEKNEFVVPSIKETPKRYDLTRIACDLLDECVLNRESKDNVSVIIVLLNAPNNAMLGLGK